MRIVITQQQLEYRGLARAAGTYEGETLAGLHGQGKTFQRRHGGPRGIVERDIVETHRSPGRQRQASGIGRCAHLGFGGEQFHQSLGRAGSALQVANHFGDGTDGTRHQHGVENKRRQITGGNAPGEHIVAAHPENHADGAEH